MEYIFTERAHLVCPNMYFAIATCIGKAFYKVRMELCVFVQVKESKKMRGKKCSLKHHD